MKRVGEEAAGLLAAMLVSGLVLMVAIPVGYIIKVLVQTGSPRLLGAVVAFLFLAGLAVLTRASWLVWLVLAGGAAVVLVARVEEVRLSAEQAGQKSPSFPFEGYLR